MPNIDFTPVNAALSNVTNTALNVGRLNQEAQHMRFAEDLQAKQFAETQAVNAINRQVAQFKMDEARKLQERLDAPAYLDQFQQSFQSNPNAYKVLTGIAGGLIQKDPTGKPFIRTGDIKTVFDLIKKDGPFFQDYQTARLADAHANVENLMGQIQEIQAKGQQNEKTAQELAGLQKQLKMAETERQTVQQMLMKGEASKGFGSSPMGIYSKDTGEITKESPTKGATKGYGSSSLGIYNKDTGEVTSPAPEKKDTTVAVMERMIKKDELQAAREEKRAHAERVRLGNAEVKALKDRWYGGQNSKTPMTKQEWNESMRDILTRYPDVFDQSAPTASWEPGKTPPSSKQPVPEATKIINGITYKKIGGKWYQ